MLQGKYPVDILDNFEELTGIRPDGKEIAELYDMQQSGAIAFGDYNKPIENDNLMKIALLCFPISRHTYLISLFIERLWIFLYFPEAFQPI